MTRRYSLLQRQGLKMLLKAVESLDRGLAGSTHVLNLMNTGITVDLTPIKRRALTAAATALRQQLQQKSKRAQKRARRA